MNSAMLLTLAVSYLLGSIPFGLLLTRAFGKGDIRAIGSGNIGATNVLRTGSKGLAAATLLLDAAKGAVAVWLAQHFWPVTSFTPPPECLIGHLYPAWLRFKGGKGVATLLGMLVAAAADCGAAVYAGRVDRACCVVLRISSVAGMAAAASAPVTAAVLGELDALSPAPRAFALLVIWKHRENIRRLVAGEEPRVGRAKA